MACWVSLCILCGGKLDCGVVYPCFTMATFLAVAAASYASAPWWFPSPSHSICDQSGYSMHVEDMVHRQTFPPMSGENQHMRFLKQRNKDLGRCPTHVKAWVFLVRWWQIYPVQLFPEERFTEQMISPQVKHLYFCWQAHCGLPGGLIIHIRCLEKKHTIFRQVSLE